MPSISLSSPSDPTFGTPTPNEGVTGKLGKQLDSKQAQKLVGWVQQAYTQGRAQRSARERQWYQNLAFYAGRQNVEFIRQATSPLGVRLRVPEAPPWRQRLVVNRIRPIIRKEIAKLTSSKPQFVAVPATNDDRDISAARAAEYLLESEWEDLLLAKTMRDTVWWTALCGTGFTKDWWDPSCGKMVQDPMTGEMHPEGDIKAETVDPFHLIIPDVRERELDFQPWVMHATTHTKDWVRFRLGKTISEKATVAATDAIMEDVQAGPFTPRPTQQVLCLETWIKPGGHRDFPQGAMVSTVGDQLIEIIDYAESGPIFDHRDVPFSKLDHIPMEGFYSDSTITDLLPLQRELNRTRSQILESKNMMSKPKWIAAKGSVEAGAITSEPGQVIFFNPIGPPPQMMQPVPIPGYVMQQIEQLQIDFDDVSGQHQISRGNAPSHTAASAIAYLQEQDDTLLSYTTASLEEMVARVGRHILSHVRQFWTGDRMIRTVGVDGSFDAMMFAVSDVAGVTDIRVQAGSSLPVSKAARTAVLMDLYSKGVFGAPGAPGQPGAPEAGMKLLTALDLGGMEKAMEDWQVDRRQIDQENILLGQGMQLPVNTYDNNVAHIAGHQRWMKGAEYRTLPPEVKQFCEMHVAMHEQELMMAQQAAMMGAPPGMAPPGIPSGPGGPPAAGPGPGGPPPPPPGRG